MSNNTDKGNQIYKNKFNSSKELKFIKPIILNEYIINKSLSTDRKKIPKPKIKYNKKLGIPISPLSNFDSIKPKNLKTKYIIKTKSENISTSQTSNKTKQSKKISSSSINIKPFLIYEESKNNNEKKDFKNNTGFLNEDIFHLRNFKTNLNKYSKIKPKITRQNNKKKYDKLIFCEMSDKFYDTKVSFKNSRDKTIEDESIKIKKIVRFWKGVMDISYPKIIINKIQLQYENSINQKRNSTFSFRNIKTHNNFYCS